CFCEGEDVIGDRTGTGVQTCALPIFGDRGLDGGAADPFGRRQKGAWTVEDLDRRDARGRQIRAEAALGLVFILALSTIPFIPTRAEERRVGDGGRARGRDGDSESDTR